MQGGGALEARDAATAREIWEEARDAAILAVVKLSELGVHKSVTNHLVEPFMWHTVIVTSTEWENFFGLRCNPLAQPEIELVANAMRVALADSSPTPVAYGDWHMPYILDDELESLPVADLVKISSGRCARVSYLTQDGVRALEKDIELYDRLMSADPAHASPLEHVATPARGATLGGNFSGWDQLRHHPLA